MSQSSLSLDHHLNELRQVAADLRYERSAQAAKSGNPNRLRVALGRAFLSAAEVLLADNRRKHLAVH